MNKIIAAIKSYFKPQETQVDMLRYRTHKMGYMLCFLAIICDCVGFAFIYSTITAVDVFNGLDIIFNIHPSNNPFSICVEFATFSPTLYCIIVITKYYHSILYCQVVTKKE